MSDYKRCDHCLEFFPAKSRAISVLQIRESKSLNSQIFVNYEVCPKCKNYFLSLLKKRPTTDEETKADSTFD